MTTDNPREILKGLQQAFEAQSASADGFAHELELSLATLIRERLGELGWTQRKLAERAGVQESYLSRLLVGEHNPTFGTAGKLLQALEVKAEIRRKADPIELDTGLPEAHERGHVCFSTLMHGPAAAARPTAFEFFTLTTEGIVVAVNEPPQEPESPAVRFRALFTERLKHGKFAKYEVLEETPARYWLRKEKNILEKA